MKPPYATVILPTLDRASTLPFALASVRAQTMESLEIFVVLDGATQACRDVAGSAALADNRITVLDLPKGMGDGAESVDHAVTRASAERIFYIDDDDLWLPDHVERLGPLLESSDVADSRVCSVDRGGGVHLGPCQGSNARVRTLLGAGRLKLIYDTHIAHRKDAYGRVSRWQQGPLGSGVWEFLAGLAKNPACRWSSCDEVTALSFHGAARRDMSAEARAAELASWASYLGRRDQLLSKASSLFHLFRLFIFNSPTGCSAEAYFESHGCYEKISTDVQSQALFDLFSNNPPSDSVAIELAVALCQPVEAGSLFESVALAYFEAYGQETHERILREVAMREGNNKASRLAAYSAALVRRDRASAISIAREAHSIGPDPIDALKQWCHRLAKLMPA